MEYRAIENRALQAVADKIRELAHIAANLQAQDDQEAKEQWVENSDLARTLHLSLKTLQSYRERGVIGYSVVGRKIYYKRTDVISLLESGRITKRQ